MNVGLVYVFRMLEETLGLGVLSSKFFIRNSFTFIFNYWSNTLISVHPWPGLGISVSSS